MKKQPVKEMILEKGLELISLKGFNNTGLQEILSSAQVPKGSFYHYFCSKSDFGLQVIDYGASLFFEGKENVFKQDIPPLEKISRFIQNQVNHYKGKPCSCNCLFGNLTSEMADSSDEFRLKLNSVFAKWAGFIQEALEEAENLGQITLPSDAATVSWFFITGWEGALIQGKLQQSVQPLENFENLFFRLIQAKVESY